MLLSYRWPIAIPYVVLLACGVATAYPKAAALCCSPCAPPAPVCCYYPMHPCPSPYTCSCPNPYPCPCPCPCIAPFPCPCMVPSYRPKPVCPAPCPTPCRSTGGPVNGHIPECVANLLKQPCFGQQQNAGVPICLQTVVVDQKDKETKEKDKKKDDSGEKKCCKKNKRRNKYDECSDYDYDYDYYDPQVSYSRRRSTVVYVDDPPRRRRGRMRCCNY